MVVHGGTRGDGPAGTPAEQPEPSEPQLFAGRYQVLEELGRGGMGRVVRAQDLKLQRAVALKLLPPGAHQEEQLQRFEQEARAAGALNHPNIVAVHDVGEHGGEPFIVSELLEGQTLRAVLSRRQPSTAQALGFATQLAEGLAAAHKMGIVHRDLKPENLFVTGEGRLKILDFGIAKLVGDKPITQASFTESGQILGTVSYMSPEQARGQPADRRSDIFSFGAIVYEMLSGGSAFERGSVMETGSAILNDEPAELPKDVPPDLRRLVRRCLEKDPKDRFQSAHDLALALARLPGSAPARSRRWPAALAAIAAVLAGAALYQWLRAQPSRSSERPSRPSM